MVQLDYLVMTPSLAKVYQKDQEKSDYPGIEPPYIAALSAEFIRNQGYNVKILDSNAEGLNLEDTLDAIKEYNPRLLHIVVMGNQPSASAQLMSNVEDVYKGVKEKIPNTKILLTGTHPAALPSETLEEGIGDYIGDGEGYFTAKGLLKGLEFSQVPGLWYRDNGEVVKSDICDLPIPIEKLGEILPTAAWDLLPMDKYRAHDWQGLGIGARQPYASIYTSFGCPFKCSFCCINATNTGGGIAPARLRWRDPIKVGDEMEMLVDKYGVRLFKLPDEMFVFKEEHYVPLAKELVRRNMGEKATIWAYARVDTVKEKNLELLKKAGFDWLCLGIEAGSKKVRDNAVKGKFEDDEIKNIVKKIKDRGIYVLGNYIYGLPDEGIEEMQETLDLALELNCERANLYCVMPYPGSMLNVWGRRTREVLKEKGKLGVEFIRKAWEEHKKTGKRERDFQFLPLPEDWDHNRPLLPEDSPGKWLAYSQHAYECWPLPTSKIHPEEILKFRDDSLRKYYKESEKYGEMLHKTFGKKNTYEDLEKFREVNAKTPRRMILGHNKP